jgi:Planctomycete cytochrome C/Leucine rich repeat
MRHPSALTAPLLALTCAIVVPVTTQAAIGFEKELWPVLQKKCIECHQAPREVNGKMQKPKADLRLDTAEFITKGSKNGAVLKAKASDKSRLYEVVTLPKDDDDFMPPKGDPLTDAERQLLKQWIDEGADFGGWTGTSEPGKSATPAAAPTVATAISVEVKREHIDFYKALEDGAKPASPDAIKAAKAAGAQVSTITATSPLVRADFLTGVSACTDGKIGALMPLADNIAQLDLGRTGITDAALATVAKLPRLARLDLRGTKITDKGLGSLTGLKKLQVLNLYGTEVTDIGLATLSQMPSLQKIFVFQTKVTEAAAKKAMAAAKHLEVVVK